MSDTIIDNWFSVNLEHDNSIAAQVLWGVVVEDRKIRWQPGDYVWTSKVVEKIEDNVFRTRNNEYECYGKGEEVTPAAESIFELRSGIKPRGVRDAAKSEGTRVSDRLIFARPESMPSRTLA